MSLDELPPEWSLLTPEHFIVPAYRCIFMGCQIVFNGVPTSALDPALVSSAVRTLPANVRSSAFAKWGANPSGIFLEISEIAGSHVFHSKESLPGMCMKLHEKRLHRQVIHIAHAAMTKSALEVDTPSSVLATLAQNALDLETNDPSKSLDAQITFEQRAAMLVGGDPMVQRERYASLVQFGLPTIDASIKSYAGTLGVVAAKTSAGKSSLVLQAMLNSIDPVLLSFEMEDWEIDAGLISNITAANRSEVPLGLSKEEHLEALRARLRTGELANIERLTQISPEFDMVAARIRQLVKHKGRKTVIVDYWTLLEPPPASNKNERVDSAYARMSRKFRQLSRELGIAIVLVAQFNREVDNGQRPTLENLRETGQLEQDANWALMLWTERPTYAPGEVRKVFAELQKNRGGQQWVKATTIFDPSTCSFREAETDPAPAPVPLPDKGLDF